MVKKTVSAPQVHAGSRVETVYDPVIEVASQYPDVESSSTYLTPFIKVVSKVMALLRFWAQGGLALRCDVLEKETM